MRHKGYQYQAWRNSLELSDGHYLSILYTSKTLPASFTNPEEYSSSELEFFIDDMPIWREDLPAEVTAEIIAELVNSAREDTSYDFGGPDEFD